MTYRRIVILLMLVGGACLLLGGMAGMYSLYEASQACGRTTGTVRRIQTKRIYRSRKIRYESRMQVCYQTPRYGKLVVSTENYNPFRSEGDEVLVWYHPDRPREIRLPWSECAVWGLLIAAGLTGICIGIVARKEPPPTKDANE